MLVLSIIYPKSSFVNVLLLPVLNNFQKSSKIPEIQKEN